MLLKFDDETKKKYEKGDIINKINNLKNEMKAEYEEKKAKERKEMIKKIAKYGIPILVLIIAVCLYFFVFKKKQIE